MATPVGETFFKDGIDQGVERKQSGETVCSALFLLAMFTQIVMSFVILGAKNAEIPLAGGGCPGDLVPVRVIDARAPATLTSVRRVCISPALYDDANMTCGRSPFPLKWEIKATRFIYTRPFVNVWEFLETYPYERVLFAGVVVFALIWLCCQQLAPKATIAGVFVIAVLQLAGVCAWFWLDLEIINGVCGIGIVGIVVGACVVCADFSDTAVIMSTAMEGLHANAHVLAIGCGLQVVWAAYLALWLEALVAMHFVMEVDEDACGLRHSTVLASRWTMLYFLLCFYWLTSFLQNSWLIPVCASLGGWYFKQQDFTTFWRSALKWSFWNQAGGNALASAIVGCSEHLLGTISSLPRRCLACLMPWDGLFACVAVCLKIVLQTYGKFGLIAMTFSGKTFCESARKGYSLLRARLGEAVLMDHRGQRVMALATYAISLGVFLGSWAWAAKHYGGFRDSFHNALALLLALVLLSCPMFSLFCVVFLEDLLPEAMYDHDVSLGGLSLAPAFVSLFFGAMTMFILTNVSKIVVGAMDTVLFCYAIEQTNGASQERFIGLYASIQRSLAQGLLAGSTVMAGQAAASPAAPAPPGSAPAPVQAAPVQAAEHYANIQSSSAQGATAPVQAAELHALMAGQAAASPPPPAPAPPGSAPAPAPVQAAQPVVATVLGATTFAL